MKGKQQMQSRVRGAGGSREDAVPEPWWRQVLHEPVALCLMPAILFRPWMDGITYPTDNFYFVWFLALLFSIWSVRQLLTGERIRFGIPLLLLALFFIVAVLAGLNTIQVNATYRMTLVWAGYFFLFVLATNGLRTRLSVGLVLGAFTTVFLAECVWGLMHFHYVLPFVRQMVKDDPRMLEEFFGSSTMTAELAFRLNTNRAFGSMLFPNALGAFLIMGIPLAFVGTIRGGRSFFQAWRTRAKAGRPTAAVASNYLLYSVILGGVTFLVFAGAGFFLYTFAQSMTYADYHWYNDLARLSLVVVLIPLAAAAGPLLLTRLHGPLMCGLAIRALVFPLALLLGLVTLWLTYSRGAMIGLFLSALFTGALYLFGRRHVPRGVAEVVALVLLAVATGLSMGTSTWAETGGADAEASSPKALNALVPPPQAVLDARPAPVVPGDERIDVKGRTLGVSDLANVNSFMNRLSYWRTALRMAKAHLWTGVGLGNFRTAYPRYQPLDAADSKMAHNDYLQTLCETGVFGVLAFLAFWGYFVFWGARRLIEPRDRSERLLLAGLYAGVLALLAHSMVDFNFYNPSLAFYLFLLTGVFYVVAAGEGEDVQPAVPAAGVSRRRSAGAWKRKLLYQVIAVPFLVAAALTAGMTMRVYLTDFILGGRHAFNVGNDREMRAKYRVGEFILREAKPGRPANSPAVEPVQQMAQLIPYRSQMESFGSLWAPPASPGGRSRRLESHEPVPPNSLLVITKPELARQAGLEAIDRWLSVVRMADSIFPYDPEVSAYLVSWYDLLLETANDPEKRKEYVLDYVKWAKACVDRSPMQAWHHEWYARALWLRARNESGAARAVSWRQSVEEFRRATELYPSSSIALRQYAESLKSYADYLDRTKRPDEAAKARTEAEQATEQSDRIAAIRGTAEH